MIPFFVDVLQHFWFCICSILTLLQEWNSSWHDSWNDRWQKSENGWWSREEGASGLHLLNIIAIEKEQLFMMNFSHACYP